MSQVSNRTSQETFIVAYGTGAMAKSGTIITSGNTANITQGQLGVISCDAFSATRAPGAFLQGGETPATVGKIKLVVGTSDVGDITAFTGFTGLQQRAYQESPEIHPGQLVSVSSRLPAIPTLSSRLFSGLTTPVAGEDYGADVTLHSLEYDRYASAKERIETYTVTVPSTVTSGLLDYTICHLVHQINLSSTYVKDSGGSHARGNAEILAFALDLDGGGSGTAIGALQVGDSVDFLVVNGVTYSITITASILETLFNWISNSSITATTEIVLVDLDNAGTLASDMFVLMGLSHSAAPALDLEKNKKVTVKAQLTGAWSNAYATNYTETELSAAQYDEGDPAFLGLKFDENGRIQINQAVTGHADTLILAPSFLDSTKRYAVRRIDFVSESVYGNYGHNNWSIVILGQTTDDSGSATAADGITVTAANSQFVTDLNAILGVWLKADPNASKAKYLGSSSSSTLFV